MNRNKVVIVFYFIAIIFFCSNLLKAQVNLNSQLKVVYQNVKGAFPLVHEQKTGNIYVDTADAEVVHIAANALIKDIETLTGISPKLQNNSVNLANYPIIIGTLGQSRLINQIFENGKLFKEHINGKWETFIIAVVDQPIIGVKQALIVAGSDRRGTAFGVFELSRMIGVSPWCWWADVTPTRHESIYITGSSIQGPPSVKYRGIFLNDEDWGLKPWAAKNMDTGIQDIGPKTYAKIFELLLRLKANYLWPAMHDCTKAFYYYPDNPKTADKYAIVIGSSHCEPLLRNNVFEWAINYENEYGTKPGEWRYDLNQQQIYQYWEDRVKQSKNYESVYTIGMRGVHDGSMPGPNSKPEKIQLLEKVMNDQRGLLSQYLNKPIGNIPQIFCPYKEVLSLYQAGLKLPDDVTIVWSDDNHGYIRQLSDPIEQKRSGGSGVYYHFSYWGVPHDYLWLCSSSPSLISYELTKAYRYGASRLWVMNVGDIKPAEMEIEFSMDLAWNVEAWHPAKAYQYAESWAAETFGDEFAASIAKIKSEYYRLSQCGKPEHLGLLNFDEAVANERIRDYKAMASEAENLSKKIPKQLQDAYFQLILYPVQGACLMNEKIFYARKSLDLAKKGDTTALEYSRKAEKAFENIKELTYIYNEKIAGGKWSGMMSWCPRNLDVFKMPQKATKEMIDEGKNTLSNPSVVISDTSRNNSKETASKAKIQGASASARPEGLNGAVFLSVADFTDKKENFGETLQIIQGLGLGGNGISILPYTMPSVPDDKATDASYLEYKVKLMEGLRTIVLKCLPTQGIYKGRNLRYAILVNHETPQIVDVNMLSENQVWRENVIRGFSIGQTNHNIEHTGEAIIRIYMLDPGLVINRIEVW